MESKHTAYVGIDPGTKGFLCLYCPTTETILFLSNTLHPADCVNNLSSWMLEYDIQTVCIEDVHSLYGMSAKSNFNFGYNVGYSNIIPMALNLPISKVTPKVWQSYVGVTKKGKEIKKDVAALCTNLFPKVNIYGKRGGLMDGKSDALMIAYYAYKHNLQGVRT